MATETFAMLAELLKQSSSTYELNGIDSNNAKCEKTSNNGEKQISIFDLSKEDRIRIFKLIEELLDTQEETDSLRQKLNEEREEFKEKRSVLIKKLDRVSEKHEKATVEIELIKEKYSSNLKQLEEKVSFVSDKLETSALELKDLRQANADLTKENLVLRKLNNEAVSVIASFQDEKSQLIAELAVYKQREKRYRKRLGFTKPTVEATPSTDEKIELNRKSTVEVDPGSQLTNFKEGEKIIDKCCGAGDFVAFNSSITSSGIDTRGTPPSTIFLFEKKLQSNATPTSGLNDNPRTHSTHDGQQFIRSSDSEEKFLLENLFFRF